MVALALKDALHWHARRIGKGIWWVMTPWRMPQRLRFMRQRLEQEAVERALTAFLEREKSLVAARKSGAAMLPERPFDLRRDADVLEAAGLPVSETRWAPIAAHQVQDRASAARFCIDLLRTRSDLYRRFPSAFSDGAQGDFSLWLQGAGAGELRLTPQACRELSALFAGDFADRARQVFLAEDRVRLCLPHGLTPSGQRSLFHWFMRYGRRAADLSVEEVWWLFLEAAENPQRELARAYLFTPAWQQEHPDGLTVFGRESFAAWFAFAYGASGRWIGSSDWPEWQAPALQVRTAYWARDAWRAAHPDALAGTKEAALLLAWLASPDAGLSAEMRDWCHRLDVPSVAAALVRPGINMIGHFCYPSGLRVSAESIVEGLRLVGVPASLRDVRTDAKDDPHHIRFDGMECHEVTVIHTQPEPFFREAYRRADLFERSPRTYRVGYWYWEFDSIPESWLEHAQEVDEVWAATEFVARGLRDRLSIPVRTLFPGVKLAPFERRDRAYFGLSQAPFTFLFTFHMMSVMERKNPLGLIRAFKAAFSAGDAVRLVLKTSFGDRHPSQIQELRDAAAGAPITIIDQVYSPDEVLSLMEACDAYVSLHRSEGLGLTMAEAMLMGKPVIATNFSGNVDFMNESNSLLVPYRLVKLGRPIPPYDANLEWAEPSVEHAAQLMRRVYENQEWARSVGARGKASAEADLSLEAAGRRILRRLVEIKIATTRHAALS